MIYYPNCKINLGLNVIQKRSDGFHNIETVFYPVNLCDALEIVPSDTDTAFTTSGISIPQNGKDNLCLSAYYLLKNEFNLPPISIHLHKNIPIGAGLGGGSADAANTLLLLNNLFELQLSDDRLIYEAQKLGSDCAFFIKNKPLFAYEKGNKFEDITITISPYEIVLVCADIHVSTPDAYQQIIPKKPIKSIKTILKQPIETWKEELINDFEFSVFQKYPAIRKIKDQLYENGAVYASMSGSGSAVFGIFPKQTPLKGLDNYRLFWNNSLGNI